MTMLYDSCRVLWRAAIPMVQSLTLTLLKQTITLNPTNHKWTSGIAALGIAGRYYAEFYETHTLT